MNSRAQIGFERRRQIQVRGSLNAALKSSDPAIPFLLACAEYLTESLARLDAQDMAISNRLKARVPTSEMEVHKGLAALDERQAKARAATAALAADVAAHKAGTLSAADLIDRIRAFADLIQSIMAPRRNPYEKHTDELFTADDWAAIADTSPQAMAREAAYFATIKSLAPPGADPDAIPALHSGPPRR